MAAQHAPTELLRTAEQTLYRADRQIGEQELVTLSLVDNRTLNVVAQVEAYGPRLAYGGAAEAEVNWSALGNQSPEMARTYASMIVLASQIAEGLQLHIDD